MDTLKDKQTKSTAEISEVFSSMQGEGILVGVKQIFVRFYRCNLNCIFCDSSRERDYKSPSADALIAAIKELEQKGGPHHSVSLTGGEPLLYTQYLKQLLPRLKERFRIYLETNGTLPQALAEIITLVDWVAMDMKLPSSTADRDYWREHEEFLRIAVKSKVFVKAVITASTRDEDALKAARITTEIDPGIPFVLQPVTPTERYDAGIPSREQLFVLLDLSRKLLKDVRVIPQVHRILGLP